MEKEVICVVVVSANVVSDIFKFNDKEKAEDFFLKICSEFFSNWSEYDQSDIDRVLESGFESNSRGSVCICWPQSGE